MTAIIRRYPCGCQIRSGAESCDHRDAVDEIWRGREIDKLNLDALQKQAKDKK